MKISWILASALLTSSVGARAEERIFNFALSESQVQAIARIVGKQPYEDVGGLLNTIQSQITDQNNREIASARAAEVDRIRKELQAIAPPSVPAPVQPEEPKL